MSGEKKTYVESREEKNEMGAFKSGERGIVDVARGAARLSDTTRQKQREGA